MKRIAIFILCAVVLSCSKDDDNINIEDPKMGQYVYTDPIYTISINTMSETGITIFENGKYVFQQLRGVVFSVIENTDYFTLTYEGLTLDIKYTTKSSFTATIKDNALKIKLPSPMHFKLDNRALDANGDGVLDSTQ